MHYSSSLTHEKTNLAIPSYPREQHKAKILNKTCVLFNFVNFETIYKNMSTKNIDENG